MRIVIDGRPLVGNRTGIGVHTAEIARRLDPAPLIASHAPIENRDGLERCEFRVDRAPLGVLWQQTRLPRIDADVLWGPHGTLPVASRLPAVVTLHDFTSITMPGRHRLQTVLSFNLFVGRSLELAKRVACVSRAVADEAMRGFGVPASKIELVPNGVDDFWFEAPPHETALPPSVILSEAKDLPLGTGEDPSPSSRLRMTPAADGSGVADDYLLFTGTLEPRKGIDDLVEAWRALPVPRPRLVLCGDPGWKTRVPTDHGIERTGYVTRERLRDLYRGALAFVYPSRYEGFGIPPLEAMACGAPVIATRTGAIGEFARDAALLVEPGDVTALGDALKRLLGDAELRRELRARGPERARLWTWARGAATMNQLLREAACA